MTSLVYGFALSTGAVRLLGGVPPKEARERLGALYHLWRRNGLFVSDPQQRHLVELGTVCDLESFPPATRKLVKDFLAIRGLPRAAAENWPQCESPPQKDVETPPHGSWFVGDEESAEWGLNDDMVATLSTSGIEVCRLDGLSQSRWHSTTTSRVLPKERSYPPAKPCKHSVQCVVWRG
jgi:hypothetical protein